MAAADAARTVLGIIGTIISFCLFLSPVPTFLKVVRWKSTRDFSGLPYVVTLLNCLLWVFYGCPMAVHPDSLLVAIVNCVGSILEMTYITIFLVYSGPKERVKVGRMLMFVLSSMALLVVLTMVLVHTRDKRILLVGSICMAVGIAVYASPLSIMRNVMRVKSVKYMPLYLSITLFINSMVWGTYGGIHFDIFITLTNGVGLLLGAFQLILYACYYGRAHPEDIALPADKEDEKCINIGGDQGMTCDMEENDGGVMKLEAAGSCMKKDQQLPGGNTVGEEYVMEAVTCNFRIVVISSTTDQRNDLQGVATNSVVATVPQVDDDDDQERDDCSK